ncbi:MAG: VWA domain-containing protein [Ignavibacteriaceae bacterium]|nr:VWA domain-containing protein [Ignavibacteriaceae bacterium]
MIFLNPAVLFGLFAASIPVLIHLFNLRKLKKIEFSTLRFLKELQKNKIRKIKLKQWLLLALRIMIILLLVTAFARPTLEGISIGGTTSVAKTTALFILDDTFSMSVVDQDGSYFNQAKQSIKNLLTQFEEGDEAALILVSSQPDKINLTTNLSKLGNKLNELKISNITNKLNNALVKAAQVLSASENFNKEIYLMTDFQKGKLATEENLEDLGGILKENVKMYSFNFSGEEVYNIALSELKVNTSIFEKNKPVSFSVNVNNYSNQPADNTIVSLYIDGERSAQQTVNIQPGATQTINMEAPIKATGYVDVFAEIEEDDVLHDNKRFTSIFIPDKINILLLYNKPEDLKYVQLALLSSSTSENFAITSKRLSQLPGLQLNSFNVIFLLGSYLPSGVNKIKDFLNNGGGLVVFPGSVTSLVEFNNMLSSLGLPSASQLIKVDVTAQSFEFEKVEFEHPIFKNIFLDEAKTEVESPQIYSYYKIQTEAKGKSIINLIDGSSFMSEYSVSEGKVFLFNSTPVTTWSDFPLKSIFAPLINKSVFYLSSKNKSEAVYLAGEKINVSISGRKLPQIRIQKPANQEDLINIAENTVSDFLIYPNTDYAGIYKFYSGEKLLENISVNTDPLESKIVYLSDDEFDAYIQKINFKGTHVRIGKDENPLQVILQARFGSELWRYFLIATLLLALVEMTVARNLKKELAEVKR